LRKAGGCGVLDQAEKQASGQGAGGDPRFVKRGDTQMIDQYFGGCDLDPEGCAQRIAAARAGASPEAIAAIYANAIGIGLQLGGMMGNALLGGVQGTDPAHTGAVSSAARNAPLRVNAQYPRAISCNVRGCVTTNGLGPNTNQSTITGPIR
jgi:hypothetical protein